MHLTKQNVIHNTFVIERNYPVPPERVFAAFSDPVKKRRWYVEGRVNTVQQFDLDFRVGGSQHVRILMGEGTPIAGAVLSNHTTHEDIVPNRRLVLASAMSINENCISVSLETFEFLPTPEGTTLIMTNQAAFFEGSDGPAMRQDGWKNLLESLANEMAHA
jgi:uncharacterized protein YndB with AHSA1/START domain